MSYFITIITIFWLTVAFPSPSLRPRLQIIYNLVLESAGTHTSPVSASGLSWSDDVTIYTAFLRATRWTSNSRPYKLASFLQILGQHISPLDEENKKQAAMCLSNINSSDYYDDIDDAIFPFVNGRYHHELSLPSHASSNIGHCRLHAAPRVFSFWLSFISVWLFTCDIVWLVIVASMANSLEKQSNRKPTGCNTFCNQE